VDVVAQDIKNIKEDSTFNDSYDRKKWRGLVMTVMALNEKEEKVYIYICMLYVPR